MQPINKISTREYDLDMYFKFESSLYAAAMKVPFKRAGGEHGHVYLIMDQEEYKTFTEKYNWEDRMPRPTMDPTFANNVTAAQIHTATNKTALDADTWHAQEGVYEGLQDVIAVSVPKAVIKKHKDKQYGFSKVSSFTLLDTIMKAAKPTNVLGVKALIDISKATYDFEGEESMTEFNDRVNEALKILKEDHDV